MKRKLKECEYVKHDIYYKNHVTMNNRIHEGWKFTHETSTTKVVLGLVLVGVGVVTLPLPTGSIPLIIIGTSLMTSGGVNLLALRRSIYWRVKTRLEMRKNK